MESPAEMEKQPGGGGGFSGEISDNEKAAAVDVFYEKLAKLNESSGLSLLFNLRQTMLDLHRFYKEVIERGGFYQVTKKGKWDDVASVSNSTSCVSLSASQLRNVYETLILEYELMYSSKMPDQANIWPAKTSLDYFGSGVNLSFSTGKRKHGDVSSPISTLYPGNEHRAYTWQEVKGAETVHKNSTVTISPDSNVIEFVADDPNAPQKPRTGYQIFLRLETHRLKMTLGHSSTQNLRTLATAAWRRLSAKDKLPYIEASKFDRERYDKEMAAYNEKQNGKSQTLFSSTTPCMLNFSTTKEPDDVYHVSLETDSENGLHSPDESAVELAIKAMKKAKSNDSIFQLDWDNNGPPDIPTS